MEKRQPFFGANYRRELLGLSARFQRQIAPQIWNESTGFLGGSQATLGKTQTPGYGKWFVHAGHRKENTSLALGRNRLPLTVFLGSPRYRLSATSSPARDMYGKLSRRQKRQLLSPHEKLRTAGKWMGKTKTYSGHEFRLQLVKW